VHHSEFTITNVVIMWNQLCDYASLFCNSYQMKCDNCGADGHFSLQCTPDPNYLASYTNDEVLEYVVYKGAHDLLKKSI